MSDKEIIEVETVKENGNNLLKVIQLDMEYLKENAEEYLTDDEKFMDLLYSISDRSGVEKLLKMRFLSGGAVPLRDILWRSGKTKAELANYKVKFRKYGDKPEEKKTEDNIVRELLMSDVLEGSFRGWENEICVFDYSKYHYGAWCGNNPIYTSEADDDKGRGGVGGGGCCELQGCRGCGAVRWLFFGCTGGLAGGWVAGLLCWRTSSIP